MGRHRQCKGCIYFLEGNRAAEKLPDIENYPLLYDGWCEEHEEERDHDEQICDWYIPRPKEKPRKTRKKLSSKLYSV